MSFLFCYYCATLDKGIPDIYVFPCGLDGQQPEKRNSLLHFFRFSAARDVEGDLANLKHR